MLKNALLFTIICYLLACAGESPTKNASPSTEKQQEKPREIPSPEKEIKKEEDNRITNANVEERLLAYGRENPETNVIIHTSKGTIKARLFKDTPLHRANFIMMAKSGCYDSTVFTRVARYFMAQGGGTYDKANAEKRNRIGVYTIPAEISKQHFHKQGALGAARSYDDNPDKRSDRSAFYFIEGTVFNDITLDKYEKDNGYKYTAEQRKYYLNHPGAAHIDGEHTVFGEITEGFSVVPKLTSVAKDSRDWPIDDLFIYKVEVVK